MRFVSLPAWRTILAIFVTSCPMARRFAARIQEAAVIDFVTSATFVGDGCKLPKKIVDETHDDATRAWHVDDAYFEDHDLQDVVDCASDGDTIRLNVSRPVQPKRQIEISKRLEIRGPRRDEEKSTRQARAKPTLTCPPNDPLFVIRSVTECFHRCLFRSLLFLGMSTSSWKTSPSGAASSPIRSTTSVSSRSAAIDHAMAILYWKCAASTSATT